MRKAVLQIVSFNLLMFSVFFAVAVGQEKTIAPVKSANQIEKPAEKPKADAAAPDVAAGDKALSAMQTAVAQEGNARRYRIGVGDELDIQVFKHPEYSKVVRVNERGIIALPRIMEPIQAACKTESELSDEIVNYYKRILRQPYVSVFIKEYKSQPVAVIGAVEKPGQLFINRRMRLLQAVALAGGPNKEAGTKVLVARLGEVNVCDAQSLETDEGELNELLFSYNLRKTIEGDESSNPWLKPGDIVSIMEADRAYVVGNVKKPSAILLKEKKTLTQAIAEAEGLLPATKKKKINLIRLDASGTKTTQEVNLEAITARKEQDPVLQPNDIIEVPLDGAKETRNNIIKALTNGLSTLTYILPVP
jgi:polysaccharide biosynthesis/export protein